MQWKTSNIELTRVKKEHARLLEDQAEQRRQLQVSQTTCETKQHKLLAIQQLLEGTTEGAKNALEFRSKMESLMKENKQLELEKENLQHSQTQNAKQSMVKEALKLLQTSNALQKSLLAIDPLEIKSNKDLLLEECQTRWKQCQEELFKRPTWLSIQSTFQEQIDEVEELFGRQVSLFVEQETNLKKLQKRNQQYEQELSNLYAQTKQWKALKEQHSAETVHRSEIFETAIEKLTEQVSTLKTAESKWNAEKMVLEEQIRNDKTEKEGLRKDLLEAMEKSRHATKRLQMMELETKTEVTQLRSDVTCQKDEVDKVRKDFIEEISVLREQFFALKREAGVLGAEQEVWAKKEEILINELNERDNLIEELQAKLQETLGVAKGASREDLESSLDDYMHKAAATSKAMGTLQMEKNDLEARLKLLEDAVEEKECVVDAHKRRIKSLEKDILVSRGFLESNVDKLLMMERRAKDQEQTYFDETSRLKQELKLVESEVVAEKERKKRELLALEQNIRVLTESKEAEEKAKQEALVNGHTMALEKDALEDRLSRTLHELELTKEKQIGIIEIHKKEIAEKNEAAKSLTSEVVATRNEKIDLMNRRDELESQTKEQQQEINRLEEQVRGQKVSIRKLKEMQAKFENLDMKSPELTDIRDRHPRDYTPQTNAGQVHIAQNSMLETLRCHKAAAEEFQDLNTVDTATQETRSFAEPPHKPMEPTTFEIASTIESRGLDAKAKDDLRNIPLDESVENLRGLSRQQSDRSIKNAPNSKKLQGEMELTNLPVEADNGDNHNDIVINMDSQHTPESSGTNKISQKGDALSQQAALLQCVMDKRQSNGRLWGGLFSGSSSERKSADDENLRAEIASLKSTIVKLQSVYKDEHYRYKMVIEELRHENEALLLKNAALIERDSSRASSRS